MPDFLRLERIYMFFKLVIPSLCNLFSKTKMQCLKGSLYFPDTVFFTQIIPMTDFTLPYHHRDQLPPQLRRS
jgi:hypothetical protein